MINGRHEEITIYLYIVMTILRDEELQDRAKVCFCSDLSHSVVI